MDSLVGISARVAGGLTPGRLCRDDRIDRGDRIEQSPSRRNLRRQIAAIERRLALQARSPSYGRGPRLLTLGELECLRDDLLAAEARAQEIERFHAAEVAAGRRLLEAMRANPSQHRFRSVSLAAVGEPGCGVYRVRPRLGPLGMMAGWWELTLSSGCP